MKRRNNRGFSLLEILIICFIGIIFVLLVFGLTTRSRELTRTMGCVNNLRQIVQAIENYQADWYQPPPSLEVLYPRYVKNEKVFHCPSDREEGNSYSSFYVSRVFSEEDVNKVFLVCPRHFGGRKTIGAYLSYSVDIGDSQKVYWSNIPAEFGKIYEGGEMTFSDGTTVEIKSGRVGLFSSFVDSSGKIYSIIYVPEGENASIEVKHQGNSRFEVITPAVIAGVAGTDFNVRTVSLEIPFLKLTYARTIVFVKDGKVKVKERAFGKKYEIKRNKGIKVKVLYWALLKKLFKKPKPPRRPLKKKPEIIEFEGIEHSYN